MASRAQSTPSQHRVKLKPQEVPERRGRRMDQKPVLGGGAGAVVREMANIRDSTALLGVLLGEALAEDSMLGAAFDELTGSVSRAFSLLDSNETLEIGEGLLETSSKMRKVIDPAAGDGRGGCRRRSHQTSLKVIKSKTLNDGRTWRKYGQKVIQSAKYPRSYFRCTHKFDQGCKAMRQVQLAEDDPSTYVITYMGEHTCRDPAMMPQLFSASSVKGTCLISFGANRHSVGHEAAVPASFPSRKDCDEEGVSNLTTASSSSDYFVMPDAEEPAALAPTAGHVSDHGDVTSGFQATADLDMDFMTNEYFEGVLRFDNDGHLFLP